MTKEQYDIKVLELNEKHKKETEELKKQFADANNPVKLADIIECRGIRIQVDSIGYYLPYDSDPKCRYSGFMITKDGKPRKDLRRETIFQHDSIKIL
jgi:hypothetical protein